jgi:hypothetical protein
MTTKAASTKETLPVPAPALEKEKMPTLSTDQKYNVRDLQLKLQTTQVQFQNAQNNAQTADQNFRTYIGKLAEELKIEVAKLQLNLDTLEFEPRTVPPDAKPTA